MDLRKVILSRHDKAQAAKIADYVGNNSTRFKELVEVYLAGPYRITQRAAWPLSLCIERNPPLIRPHLRQILEFLNKPGIHDAVKRNTMRLLQFVEIPRRFHGKVAAIGFDYLQDKKSPVAVKVFAMTVLSRISQLEPDLKRELRLVIEGQLPYSTPGFVSRAGKVLREIA